MVQRYLSLSSPPVDPMNRTLRLGGILATSMLLMVAACSSSPQTVDGDQGTESVTEEEVTLRPEPDFSSPPEDYSTAEVLGVVASPQGSAVLLGANEQESVLPIFINPSQAMAIQLGLDGETFVRPLTHDLVDHIMKRLDTEIGKIQVDELRDGTFFATIFLITPTEVMEIDARPSDAIALAVKDNIPIYVADEVLDIAAFTEEDLRDLPPADPGDPDDFRDSPTTPL